MDKKLEFQQWVDENHQWWDKEKGGKVKITIEYEVDKKYERLAHFWGIEEPEIVKDKPDGRPFWMEDLSFSFDCINLQENNVDAKNILDETFKTINDIIIKNSIQNEKDN